MHSYADICLHTVTPMSAKLMSAKLPVRKILVLAANPQETPRLGLDDEVRGIQRSLQLSKERDRFQLISEWAVRTEDLIPLLTRHQPHIVHFLGHGSGDRDRGMCR
jgi:hypothetical protein